MRSRLAASLALLLAASCGGDDDPPEIPARGYDVRSYELRGRFDWEARRLIASVDISVVVGATGTTIQLDSGVEVSRVHAGGRDLPFTADGELLTVDLASLSPADSPVSFTIDYQAPATTSLVASRSRDDDPVTSRVVYTNSEPRGGRLWMPSSDRPDDRARFAVELTVAADEDVVANGARVKDELTSGSRVVRHEMDDPIPTYIMAWAAGQLEHTDRAGPVPLSLWYRRGLAIDPARNLDAVADAMTTFERLLGAYPFERYSVVLLPEFGGGMENATITFNSESSGQGNVSFNLNAHELGHQWFGDYVTIESFDDLWIKEGMATLLATEADRARRDAEDRGRLLGLDFAFNPTDAVRDLALPLEQRYTTGPYTRAAWLLTQIRARVGEDAFWGTLRDVLEEHALGTVDSESFVRAFAPALDEATIGRVLAALGRREVPVIDIEVAGDTASFTLSDPGQVLIAPLEVRPIDAGGVAGAAVALVADQRVSVTVPGGGYLAVDEMEAHVEWTDSFEVGGYELLAPLLAPPPEGAAAAAFLERSAAQQERATYYGVGFDAAAGVAGFYAGLDSTFARRYVEIYACRRARAGEAGWADATAQLIRTPSLSSFSTSYSGCGATLPAATFGGELTALAADPAPAMVARLSYLLGFDYGAATLFAAAAPLAASAPSLQLRDLAINRLGYQIANFGYSGVPDDERPAWQSFFRDRLAAVTSQTRFLAVWRGIYGLRDDSALLAVAAKLRVVPMSDFNQRAVVCQAFTVASARTGAWAEFQAAIPVGSLRPGAEAALRDPARCAN
jgi:hypothetical protein